MKRITMVGLVDAYTGYGFYFAEIFAGLSRKGYFVAVRKTRGEDPPWLRQGIPLEIKSRFVTGPQPEDWEIAITTPEFIPTLGKKTVYCTMWETDRLRPDYVENLNKSEVVVVPCQWNKETFIRSGVTVPIVVIPLGYSPDIFSYMEPPKSGKFVFGAAGREWGGRKGFGTVIECFQKAFPIKDGANVELRIKNQPDSPLPDIPDHRIKITKTHLEWHQVKKWLAELNVFVSLAASEGFGLWQLHAMATGRPVISPLYGGVAQFMDDGNALIVDHSLVRCSADFKCGQWSKPDEKHVIQLMRASVKAKGFQDVGRQASLDVVGLTWQKTVDELFMVLKNVGAI